MTLFQPSENPAFPEKRQKQSNLMSRRFGSPGDLRDQSRLWVDFGKMEVGRNLLGDRTRPDG